MGFVGRGCRWLGIGVFAVVALALVGHLYLGQILARYRPEIERELSALVKLPIRFQSIEISLLPRASLVLQNVRLLARQDCPDAVASIDALYLDMSLEALLERDLKISHIRIVDPRADFEMTAENLSFALPASSTCQVSPGDLSSAPVPQAVDGSGSQSASGVLPDIELNEFHIVGGEIKLRNGGAEFLLAPGKIEGGISMISHVIRLTDLSMVGAINALPLVLESRNVEYDPVEKQISVREGMLDYRGERITFNGSINSGDAATRMEAQGRKIQLDTLRSLLQSLGGMKETRLPSGQVDFKVMLEKTSDGQYAGQGDLSIAGLRDDSRQIRAQTLSLSGMRVTTGNNGTIRVSGSLAAAAFEIRAGTDSYSSGSVSGDLDFQGAAQKFESKGTLQVGNFRYSNGRTSVDKVQATLSQMRVVRAPSGDIEATVQVDGSSLNLSDPGVVVHAVRKISAPMRILIPGRGGYSISGPVQVEDGEVTTLDRTFSKVSGRVQLSLARGLDVYSTPALRTEVSGVPLQLAVTFRMLPDAFSFEGVSVTGAAVRLSGAGRWERQGNKKFSLNVLATASEPVTLARVYDSSMKMPLNGRIEHLEARLSGESLIGFRSLRGEGSYVYRDATGSRGLGLAAEIADALRKVPALSVLVSAFESDKTPRGNSARFQVLDEKVMLSAIQHSSERFSLEGSGSVSFSGALDLSAEVIFMRETVRRLGLGVGALQRILSLAGSIKIPIYIRGNVSDAAISIDLATFTARYSGLSTVTAGVEGLLGLGQDLGSFVTRPFRGGGATPVPSPVPAP